MAVIGLWQSLDRALDTTFRLPGGSSRPPFDRTRWPDVRSKRVAGCLACDCDAGAGLPCQGWVADGRQRTAPAFVSDVCPEASTELSRPSAGLIGYNR